MTEEEIKELISKIENLESENRILKARFEDLQNYYPVVSYNGFVPMLPVDRHRQKLPQNS